MDDVMATEVWEAVLGVQGEICGDCLAEAPLLGGYRSGLLFDPAGSLPCTRPFAHTGDHVAAHTDGRVLARWPQVVA